MPQIDIHAEKLVSLIQATKILPNRPSTCTLWRWRTKGIAGVKLATVIVGGRRYTSHEAVRRFIEASTAAKDGEPVHSQAAGDREKEIKAAEAELERLGV